MEATTLEKGEFQSTLPVWGGTQVGISGVDAQLFQSTLPVWGGTPLPVSME